MSCNYKFEITTKLVFYLFVVGVVNYCNVFTTRPQVIENMQSAIKRSTVPDKAQGFCREAIDLIQSGQYDEDLAKGLQFVMQCGYGVTHVT